MIKVCGAWPGALGSGGKVAVIMALNNRPHNPISFGPAGESGSNHGSKSFGEAIITLILGRLLITTIQPPPYMGLIARR